MKILIVHASAGAGHRKCAEAVHEVLKSRVGAQDEVKLIDSLDYTSKFFRWIYASQYLTMIHHMPAFWGFFYFLFDNALVYKILSPLRRMINGANLKRFEEFLLDFKPDAIISAHFMANEIIANMKKKKGFQAFVLSVITDFMPHSFWITSGVDAYTVATEKTRQDVIRRGVDPGRVTVTGIPVSLKFAQSCDRQTFLDELGLKPDIFTMLMVSGGFGVGPLEEMAGAISELISGAQLMVVCGRNPQLTEKLQKKFADSDKVRIFGFVDNMHQLMQSSDLLITKSGGLTTSEALSVGLPMIVYKPIPGQEGHNCKLLVDLGAAVKVSRIEAVPQEAKRLAESPEEIAQMKKAALKISKPQAAAVIADMAYEKS